jgi:hypothetical protein
MDLRAEAATACERIGLTADRLPALLRETPAGTPLQALSIHPFQLAKGQMERPLMAFLLPEPAAGWEDTLRANLDRYLVGLGSMLNDFLAGATPVSPLPPRLTAMRQHLLEQAATLRTRLAELEPAYQKTCAALAEQQRRQREPRRWWTAAFDAAQAVPLWNAREAQYLKLASVRAAQEVFGTAIRRLDEAGAHVARASELVTAAMAIAGSPQPGHSTADSAAWIPGWTPDLPGVASRLAVREPDAPPDVFGLLSTPPATTEIWLDALRAAATIDAQRLVAGLTVPAAVDLQRELESALPPEIDPLVAVCQHVLDTGILARRFPFAGAGAGAPTILQLTPDGRPLVQTDAAGVDLRCAPIGISGQIAFLEMIEDVLPSALTVGREAAAAVAAAQDQQNQLLLEEMLPTHLPGAPAAFIPEPVPPARAIHENGHAGLPSELIIATH